MLVDGREQTLTIIRQERIHGSQGYWLCPMCGAARWHLYLLGSQIGCRVCLRLTYASRRTKHGAALRARKLRRKLGAAPGLLAPLPPRPRNVWAAAYYDKLVRKLALCETAIAGKLREMVRR